MLILSRLLLNWFLKFKKSIFILKSEYDVSILTLEMKIKHLDQKGVEDETDSGKSEISKNETRDNSKQGDTDLIEVSN